MMWLVLMTLGVQTGSLGLIGQIIVFTHARDQTDYAVDTILE